MSDMRKKAEAPNAGQGWGVGWGRAGEQTAAALAGPV